MPDRQLTNAEIHDLAESHNTPAITAAGSHNGANQFIAVVTAQGLQNLVASRHITQAQCDLIVQRATLPPNTDNDHKRYIIAFEGADAGHLTPIRAFSAVVGNEAYQTQENSHASIRAIRTLNLAAGGNPMSQLVSDGPNGGQPSLYTRLSDGGIGQLGPNGVNSLGGSELFMRFMRTNRYAMNYADSNMEQALAKATKVPLAPLPGTQQGVDATGTQFVGAPLISKENSLG